MLIVRGWPDVAVIGELDRELDGADGEVSFDTVFAEVESAPPAGSRVVVGSWLGAGNGVPGGRGRGSCSA